MNLPLYIARNQRMLFSNSFLKSNKHTNDSSACIHFLRLETNRMTETRKHFVINVQDHKPKPKLWIYRVCIYV